MPGMEMPAFEEPENLEAKMTPEDFEKFGQEFETSRTAIESVLYRLRERMQYRFTDFIDEEHGGLLENVVEEMRKIDFHSVESFDRAVDVLDQAKSCIDAIQLYPGRGMSDDAENLSAFSYDVRAVGDAAARMDDFASKMSGSEGGVAGRLFQISSALKQIADEKSAYIRSKAEALS